MQGKPGKQTDSARGTTDEREVASGGVPAGVVIGLDEIGCHV